MASQELAKSPEAMSGEELVSELEERAPIFGVRNDVVEALLVEYRERVPEWLEEARPPCPVHGEDYEMQRVDGHPAGCEECRPESYETEERYQRAMERLQYRQGGWSHVKRKYVSQTDPRRDAA